ncbi:transglycosylase SLT domain-containing protein [Luteimonas sp. e5]
MKRAIKPRWYMRAGLGLACLLAPFAATAAEMPAQAPAASSPQIATRSGLEIHRRFREHLAEPDCSNADPRWTAHYERAPRRMASHDDELLALFGYVVDELVQAGLPTEYALIPFVESRYNPAARSKAGPAGLWQFIALTARNQGVKVTPAYDGRMSVVDSTRAAVRYLKILHSMFGGNWRVAIMGYNAGEYRVLGAIKRSGMQQRQADAKRIQGLPALTRAYVEKLHAITCLIEQAEDRAEWLQAIDRPVPVLTAESLQEDAASLEHWARAQQLDAGMLKRLNPALASVRLNSGPQAPQLLVPRRLREESETTRTRSVIAAGSAAESLATASRTGIATGGHTHYTVVAGDSWWAIARRHGLSTAELLRRNGLRPGAALRPGMVLKLDATPATQAN